MAAKQEAHELLQDLERVTRDLNRIPNRVEYQNLGRFNTQAILDIFGSYALMLKASGLSYSRGKVTKKEKQQQAFEHLKKEIEERVTPFAKPPQVYSHIFVWPDRHHPYSHPDTISFLIAINRKYNFDLIVDIGDGEDFHALSFHDSDSDILSAGHELEQVIKEYQPLYKEFPKMMICESNHSSMVYRKGKHHGLPRRVLKSYREMLEAPAGWEWHHEIIIQMSNGQKVLFHHGLSSNVLAASQKRSISLVQGHFHSKHSIQYWENSENKYFAAQTGCLIDDKSYAFAYNKLTIERPILGCLRIENGIPHLLPMQLDKSGRWNGVIP